MSASDLYSALAAVTAPRNGGVVGALTDMTNAGADARSRRAALMSQALAGLRAPSGGGAPMPGGGYAPPSNPRGQGLATIVAPNGERVTVSATYAPKFAGLLRDLWNAGYHFSDVSGYNYRNIAGTNTLSKHAFGEAIDIDPGKNPVTYNGRSVTEFNPNIVLPIIRKYGLDWGALWSGKKDPMHFSTGG
jgi:D-alanyl-D-alanine carboxypeptidase-like protein